MASVDECERAFGRLADRLAEVDPARRKKGFERTLCCAITDLDTSWSGRIKDGLLLDIRQVEDGKAKVRLELSSDDLLELVDGDLNLATAWAGGRLKVRASPLDLVRLKSVF